MRSWRERAARRAPSEGTGAICAWWTERPRRVDSVGNHPAFEHPVRDRRGHLVEERGAHLRVALQEAETRCSSIVFGSLFLCHSCSQDELWYFWTTLSATMSRMGNCAYVIPAVTHNATAIRVNRLLMVISLDDRLASRKRTGLRPSRGEAARDGTCHSPMFSFPCRLLPPAPEVPSGSHAGRPPATAAGRADCPRCRRRRDTA